MWYFCLDWIKMLKLFIWDICLVNLKIFRGVCLGEIEDFPRCLPWRTWGFSEMFAMANLKIFRGVCFGDIEGFPSCLTWRNWNIFLLFLLGFFHRDWLFNFVILLLRGFCSKVILFIKPRWTGTLYARYLLNFSNDVLPFTILPILIFVLIFYLVLIPSGPTLYSHSGNNSEDLEMKILK